MIHIDELGRGDDHVVFLHGTPQDPSDFGRLAAWASERARTLLVHAPGCGRSDALADLAHDVRGADDAIAEALRSAYVRRPVLIGFSGGAYRALDIVLRCGMQPRAVLLLGGYADLSAEHREALRGAASNIAGGAPLEPLIEASYFSPSFSTAHPARVREVVSRTVASVHREVLAAEVSAMASAPSLLDDLARWAAPLVLRVGALDRTIPAAYSAEIAARTGAACDVVEGAGHALHHEDPEGCIAALAGLMART